MCKRRIAEDEADFEADAGSLVCILNYVYVLYFVGIVRKTKAKSEVGKIVARCDRGGYEGFCSVSSELLEE
jgi:hypothetical protein